MEYHPKHPQPFSFSDALRFEPATITEGSVPKYNILWASGFKLTRARTNDAAPPLSVIEIGRLQNSLRHLKRTQDELRAYNSDDDPELVQALKENEAVMSVIALSVIIKKKNPLLTAWLCARLAARLRKSGSVC